MIGDFKTLVVMKKSFKSILCVAAAAMTLASCGVKEIAPEVKPEGKVVYFGTEVNDLTKASLTTEDDANFIANWENNDVLNVSGFVLNEWYSDFSGTWDAEKKAFAVTGADDYFDDTNDFIGVYPQAVEGVINFGSARTQDGNNYAGKYDVMCSEATSLTLVEGETFVLPMDRQTAIAYFHLTSTLPEEEKIVSATLSVNENLAGSFLYDEGEIEPDATENSITLSFTNAPSVRDLKLWFNVFPGTYTGLKLEVETEKHTLTIQNPNKVTYEQGKLYKVAANATAKYAFKDGEYVFTAINESDHYIMPAYTTGNNIKALAYTLNGEDKIVVNEEYDAADCIYTITRVTEGEYVGSYTIQDANGLYIYPNSDSKNQLVADDKLNSSAYYWDIDGNDVTSRYEGRNCMRFNYNSGSPLFSCYENNTKQSPIAIVSASNVVIDETPKFKLSGNTLSVDSDGTLKDEITVTPNRYCGDISFNVSYTDGEGWISDIAIVDGKLSMTVNANEETERVATVTLSATGAESQSVTVTQAAYVPGGDTVEGTITFGSADGSLNVNSANVSGKDNNDIQWTVATVGTTSFTANNGYAQIGSSNKPATSITFTATIPSGKEVTDFEAKFGGFSATAGSVKLYVDDVEVGSGSLNESNDVTVTASNVPAAGTNLKVTVTGIAKGVKVYYITYAYGDDNKTPQSLSFDATIGTWDLYTNTGNLPTLDASGAYTSIEYSSSDETVATVNASTGVITAKKTGTTTITATAPGDATYKKATATYELTIKDSKPVITIKKATENISSAAGSNLTIADAYSLTNVADAGITVTYTGNITAASISGGTVTYTISENDDTSNPKDSKIILTVTSDSEISGEITVTQAKKGSTSKVYRKVSSITSGKTYLIVGGTVAKVMQHPTSSNATVAATNVTITDNAIASNDETNACAVVITKVGNYYTITFDTNKYVAAAGSNTNLKYVTTAPSGSSANNAYWDITTTTTKGSFQFKNSSQTSRAIIWRASSTNKFGDYATSNVTSSGTEYFNIDLYELQ